MSPWSSGFNPLHCGAVVASRCCFNTGYRSPNVSIPFIAGQWSLPGSLPPRAGTASCLNPLHCGAVVASVRAMELVFFVFVSQSPSLRGSGRFLYPLFLFFSQLFSSQSPSLRGSGRFAGVEGGGAGAAGKSQSPSLRGSGRFPRGEAPRNVDEKTCLNPLHCGAVVASRRRRTA